MKNGTRKFGNERATSDGRATPNANRHRSTDERLLTASEIAELLAVPESWVREATRQGLLPHLALGRYRRYSRTAISDWLDEQTIAPRHRGTRDLHTDPETSL